MSELRHDPLTGRWVVINPARAKRPQETLGKTPDCPLCRGNEKVTPPEIYAVMPDGQGRKDYRGSNYGDWVLRDVPNKFSLLDLDSESRQLGRRGLGLYDRMDGYGAHEVIIECPGPEHIEIADCMPNDLSRIEMLLRLFKYRLGDLALNRKLIYFLLFKNYKPDAGASLSHPHCQLTGMPVIPIDALQELILNRLHFEEKNRCLLCDVIEQEMESKRRLVIETQNFIVFCPYASRFPGEMLLAPTPERHSHIFHDISNNLVTELAEVFVKMMKKLKVACEDPAYNWDLHSAPVRFSRKNQGETIEEDTHWHLHVYPRVTKIAGFEIGCGFYANPSPPEDIAQILRETQIQ